MDPWLTLPLLLVPFDLGAGWMAVLGIRARPDPLGWLGWSWAAGALATGAVLLAWALAQAPWSRAGVPAFLLALAAALHLVGRRRVSMPTRPAREASWRARPRPTRVAFHAALAVALFSLLDRILLASLHPILGTDEGRIYAAPAKILFELPGLAPHYGEVVRHSLAVTHPEYPLLNPLLQVFGFTLSGHVVHFLSRLPIQAFTVATLLVLASGLRRRAHPLVGAVLLLLFAAVPGGGTFDLASLAYSDGMCALGLLIAVDAWMRFEEDGERSWTWLAALGLALGAASKNEGLLFALVFVPVAGLRLLALRGRSRPGAVGASVLALVAFLPAVVTALLDRRYGFRSDLLTGRNPLGKPIWDLLGGQMSERGWPTAERLFREVVLDPPNTRLLFALFLLLLLLLRSRSLRGALAVPTAVLATLFVGLYLVFVASPFDLDWHFRLAGARVYSQLLAATTLWIGVAFELARGPASDASPQPPAAAPAAHGRGFAGEDAGAPDSRHQPG